MKQKTLYYLAATFFVLLILYFLTKPRFTTTNIDEIVQSIVIGVSTEDVASIEVYKEKGEDKIEMKLAKDENDKWRIPTYFNAKVRTSDVDRLIKDVLEMQGKVRATGENFFDQFKIGDAQGVHIILKDVGDKALANLIIGKKGEDYGSGFVRFAGKDKIFFGDKNLLTSLKIYGEADTLTTFKQSSFVDLNAVEYEVDDLETVAVVKGNAELVVKKVEKEVEDTSDTDSTATEPKMKKITEWVLEKAGQQIDLEQAEVDKFLNDVKKIYAQKVVDRVGESLGDLNKVNKYGFNRPIGGIIYIKNGGERVQCVFGKEYEADKGYFFQNGEDGMVYHIAKSTVDKIFKWIDDLPTKTKAE